MENYILIKPIPHHEQNSICPDCGGEVLTNKPSGAAFCMSCDYEVKPTKENCDV